MKGFIKKIGLFKKKSQKRPFSGILIMATMLITHTTLKPMTSMQQWQEKATAVKTNLEKLVNQDLAAIKNAASIVIAINPINELFFSQRGEQIVANITKSIESLFQLLLADPSIKNQNVSPALNQLYETAKKIAGQFQQTAAALKAQIIAAQKNGSRQQSPLLIEIPQSLQQALVTNLPKIGQLIASAHQLSQQVETALQTKGAKSAQEINQLLASLNPFFAHLASIAKLINNAVIKKIDPERAATISTDIEQLEKENNAIPSLKETTAISIEPQIIPMLPSPITPKVEAPALTKGVPVYLAMQMITPGQLRISSKRVAEKFASSQKKGGLRFDNGKSALDISEALPVIKAPFGYVLVDGHHEFMANRALEGTTVPVKLVDDLSASGDTFWDVAFEKGYVYPFTVKREKKIPVNFDQLEDDPNRFFAGVIIARKCAKEGQSANDTIGAEFPVWIKIGKDIPFIEFMIADALSKAGITYDYRMGDLPPQEFIEKARAALVDAVNQAKKNGTPLKDLKIIPQRTKFDQIKNICVPGAAIELFSPQPASPTTPTSPGTPYSPTPQPGTPASPPTPYSPTPTPGTPAKPTLPVTTQPGKTAGQEQSIMLQNKTLQNLMVHIGPDKENFDDDIFFDQEMPIASNALAVPLSSEFENLKFEITNIQDEREKTIIKTTRTELKKHPAWVFYQFPTQSFVVDENNFKKQQKFFPDEESYKKALEKNKIIFVENDTNENIKFIMRNDIEEKNSGLFFDAIIGATHMTPIVLPSPDIMKSYRVKGELAEGKPLFEEEERISAEQATKNKVWTIHHLEGNKQKIVITPTEKEFFQPIELIPSSYLAR